MLVPIDTGSRECGGYGDITPEFRDNEHKTCFRLVGIVIGGKIVGIGRVGGRIAEVGQIERGLFAAALFPCECIT